MLVAKLFGPPCFFTEIVKFYSLHVEPYRCQTYTFDKSCFPGI